MLIFEQSQPGRAAGAQAPGDVAIPADLPKALLRDTRVGLPEVSESHAVRHYANPAKARAA